MTDKKVDNIIEKKLMELKDEREKIFRMEPEDALNEIIDYSNNIPLVHSFPEQSFYMLMHEVGHEDFLPVLSMANKRQWEYVFDQEIWYRDTINIHDASYWLGIFHLADPARLASWLLEDQGDFFSYYLRNRIEVVIREHDQDPSDIGEGFRTIDDVIYFKIHGRDDKEKLPVDEESLISDILFRIAEKSYPMFQTIIFISAGVINAEHEEELYRLRNARLEEKGLLPLFEAIEIYAPLKKQEIDKKIKHGTKADNLENIIDDLGNLDSKYMFEILSIENYFTLSGEFAAEFVALCNQVIVADKKTVRSRDELNKVVERVSGILKAGAQILGELDKKSATGAGIGRIFSEYFLKDIFRVGHTRIRFLREKALSWKRNSWILHNELGPGFIGEKWFGIAGGLFVWPPVYYDNYETCSDIYRNFNCLEDIEKTEVEMDKILAVDDLLALFGVKEINIKDNNFLFWDIFLLTLWARKWLNLDETIFEALSFSQFKEFYNWLWDNEDCKKIIDENKKKDFLNWVTAAAKIETELMLERLGTVFSDLFDLVENEFKDISPENLNIKYIKYFLVEQ
ncbi:MAG: hypothetical protein CSB21_03320 [Deltaproteobacteria bacterium]|nr:MAG: hypothetical protein CSB21_03320 [Deltaproteobacteria bacterium]